MLYLVYVCTPIDETKPGTTNKQKANSDDNPIFTLLISKGRLPARLPACHLRACLPVCPPACRLAYFPACPPKLPACLPTCLPTCLHARLPACLPVCLFARRPAFSPACVLACQFAYCPPACLPACLFPRLPAFLPACHGLTHPAVHVRQPEQDLLEPLCCARLPASLVRHHHVQQVASAVVRDHHVEVRSAHFRSFVHSFVASTARSGRERREEGKIRQ